MISEDLIITASDRRAVEEGCWFDDESADRACRFIEKVLVHPHGPLYGKPYELIPWQRDLVRRLFGWKNAEGKRRFRFAYIEVPKKNNKTGLSAAILNYLLAGEGKSGKQIYSAASDRKQASMIFTDMMVMIPKELRETRFIIKESSKEISLPERNNEYRSLAAEADTAEGLRIYALVFDELHVQKNRRLWDSLRYGMASEAASDEPIMIIITTAGLYDPESIAWHQHQFARGILDGTITDPTYFALIYSAEDSDDWMDPATWRKANPSLGITISESEMAQACEEAKLSPATEAAFKRYRLDMWVANINRYLPSGLWETCVVDAMNVHGEYCYGGLDLGQTRDFTAFTRVWPMADGRFYTHQQYWMPEASVTKIMKEGRFDVRHWIATGRVVVTSGEVVDYGVIEDAIKRLNEECPILQMAYDKFNAGQIAQDLENAGIEMIDMPQWGKYLSEPMRQMTALLQEKRLLHDDNPVTAWMASNLDYVEDKFGYIRPMKETKDSALRIDGMVALIMALARAIPNSQQGIITEYTM